MARQFEKPGQALKPASGFLRSGAPCPLNPKEINRGDYCHRFFICSKQKKIDPNQTVCLICNNFLPICPQVDPLAQAKVMGYTLGYKTIRTALAFEAKGAKHAEDTRGELYIHPDEPTARANAKGRKIPAEDPAPTPKPKRKLNGRGRKLHPPPAPGMKRCSNRNCNKPVLPADADHFYRNKNTPDGLRYRCKACHNKDCARWWQRKKKATKKSAKMVKTEWVKAGPPICGEVMP